MEKLYQPAVHARAFARVRFSVRVFFLFLEDERSLQVIFISRGRAYSVCALVLRQSKVIASGFLSFLHFPVN